MENKGSPADTGAQGFVHCSCKAWVWSLQGGPTGLGAAAALSVLPNQLLAPAPQPKCSLWPRRMLCPPTCTKGLQSTHGSLCSKHQTNPCCKYLVAIPIVSWRLSQMQRSLPAGATPAFLPPSNQGRAWESGESCVILEQGP